MKKNFKDALYKQVGEMGFFSSRKKHKRAVALAKRILSEIQLDSVAFSMALGEILAGAGKPEKLKKLVHSAYNRLSSRGKERARIAMLYYHHSIKDMKTAMVYVT